MIDLPGFEIRRLIGRGGFGAVYEALWLERNLQVALKVVGPISDPAEEHALRFERETAILQTLKHCSIVTIHTSGSHDAYRYIVMDLVVGITLGDLIEHRAPLEARMAIGILRRLVDAVDYLHGKGIIHRDLNPSNVLIDMEGRIRLVDFGLARGNANDQVTRPLQVLGTRCYLAPESLDGESPGRPADIHSLGLIAYQMMTGDLPYYGSSAGEWKEKILEVIPVPLHRHDEQISRPVSDFISSLLAKAPDSRPTAREALARLEKLKTIDYRVEPDLESAVIPIQRHVSRERASVGPKRGAPGDPELLGPGNSRMTSAPTPARPPKKKMTPGKHKADPRRAARSGTKEPQGMVPVATPDLRSNKDRTEAPQNQRESGKRRFAFAFLVISLLSLGVNLLTSRARRAWSTKDVSPMIQSMPGPPSTTPWTKPSEAVPIAHRIAPRPTLKLSIGQTGTHSLIMVSIPGGTFRMGSDRTASRREETPVHLVTVRAFYLGRHEVTRGQFRAVMGLDPSVDDGEIAAAPVSISEAREFCRRVGAATGRAIRLPSEAEWEFACRALVGDEYPIEQIGGALSEHAWYLDESAPSAKDQTQTHPVGLKKPNGFGLEDMGGNVAEWCEDSWHPTYHRAPVDGRPWMNDGDPDRGTLRGGSFLDGPEACRCASRSSAPGRVEDGGTPSWTGIRIACDD